MPKKVVHRIGWDIASHIRSWRAAEGISLRDLQNETKKFDLERQKGVSAAQINRIERGEVDPSMRDYHLLCLALGKNPAELMTSVPGSAPWLVLRKKVYNDIVSQMERADSPLELERRDRAHEIMFKNKIYRYLPLELPAEFSEPLEGPADPAVNRILSKLVANDDYHGILQQSMRAYLFEFGYANDELLLLGADEHDGEELVMILDGTAEFWIAKPLNQMSDPEQYKRGGRTVDDYITRTLEEGDIAHYSAHAAHGYRSLDPQKPVRALFIYAAPTRQPTTDELFTTPTATGGNHA